MKEDDLTFYSVYMKFSYCSLFLVLLFSACKSPANSSGAGDTGVLIPLAVGNTWTSDEVVFFPDGSTKNDPNVTLAIEPVARVSNGITFYFYDSTVYLSNRSDGVYATDPSLLFSQLYFKYPANIGDTFRSEHDTSFGVVFVHNKDSIVQGVSQFIVTGKDVPITVPAGTYSCLKYQTDWVDIHSGKSYSRNIEYFAPNVGEIMKEQYTIDSTNSLQLLTRSRLLKVTLH